MAVLFQATQPMMYLGLVEDSFTKDGQLMKFFKANLMDTSTNEIHQMAVSPKNEVLMKQIEGLKMAGKVQLTFELYYDKYAVNKKQNPTKWKLVEIYPA